MKIPKAPPAKATMMLSAERRGSRKGRPPLRFSSSDELHAPIFTLLFATNKKKKENLFTSTPTNDQLPALSYLAQSSCCPTREYTRRTRRYTLGSFDPAKVAILIGIRRIIGYVKIVQDRCDLDYVNNYNNAAFGSQRPSLHAGYY